MAGLLKFNEKRNCGRKIGRKEEKKRDSKKERKEINKEKIRCTVTTKIFIILSVKDRTVDGTTSMIYE